MNTTQQTENSALPAPQIRVPERECCCEARMLIRRHSHLMDIAEEAVFNEHGNYNEDAKRAAHIAADALIRYMASQLDRA